ncbi:MAG: class II aldolase/adducin family protein [Hyphomonadaceae bacterium]|jgi:HCOMODA/2-hydroxy-3-carboxy-muconic semialdehyde decarboxylase|nr:class II aldolase/adducin family protein [Hyphomonadaceae bacterium]
MIKACGIAVCVLAAAFCGAPVLAQAPAVSGGPVDAAVVEDLVAANRILADQGVLDGFGHVSIRHPGHPNRLLLSRSLAPALTAAGDIMEYDVDQCAALDARGRSSFLERFIHCEIYKARADVKSVIHTHSPGVVPFAASQVPLRPMYHVAGFLAAGVPVFEIRRHAGMTNMLIGNARLGKALADTLGDKAVVLMRGHGNVVVAPSVQVAVYRAVYTEINARLQAQAIALGGPITYLEREEGEQADVIQQQVVMRPWELWRMKALGGK